MDTPRQFPAVPRSVEEADILRSSIAQAQTEKNFTARRLGTIERAVKEQADRILVLMADKAESEARIARLEERMSHVWAHTEA
jgi:hypothetical protein